MDDSLATEDYFRLKDVDHHELTSLLLRDFGSSSGIAPRISRLPREGTRNYLDIHFDRKGTISKIVPSPRFARQELRAIGDKIQAELVEDRGVAFGFWTAYCDAKVDGFFNYKGAFQILPMPEGAALPNVAVADHPFLIQVAYRGSRDPLISTLRLHRAVVAVARLLNVLLTDRVHLGPRWAQFAWVIDPSDLARPTSHWNQIGYWFTNPYPGDRFVDTSAMTELRREKFQDYYLKARYRSTEALVLPDNLEASITRAARLDAKDRDRLELASIAFQTSSQILADSTSAAYVSLVIAIETLMREDKVDRCECCGQPMYQLSRKFRQFIEKHAPMIQDHPIAKERLYRTRSEIAHGLDVFEVDRAPFGWGINSRRWDEDQLYRTLHFIVGIAIYNWLWSRAI